MSRTSLPRPVAAGLALAGTVAALLLSAPAALAAPALPPPAVPATVTPGTAFPVSGTGCVTPGTFARGVLVSVDGADGLTAPADVNLAGEWSTTVTLPAGTAAGPHVVHAVCDLYTENYAYPDVTVTVPGATLPKPTTAANCAACKQIDSGAPVAPGQKLTLTFTGYQPFERVSVVLHSTPVNLGTFTADAHGVLTVSATIPAGFSGAHSLNLTDSNGVTTALPFTVANTAGQLAWTGTDITAPLVLGGSLVLVGAGVLVAVRRRPAGARQA